MELRLTDGTWVKIDFDGSSCDGCGQLSHLGQPLGQACVDTSEILTFQGAPW